MRCKYGIAYVAAGCDAEAMDGADMCVEHWFEKCCSCGGPATHQCCMAFQFVCGFPLCDNCIDDGKGKHVRKEE